MLKKFAAMTVGAAIIGSAGTASATPIVISSGGSYGTSFLLVAPAQGAPNNFSALVNFEVVSLSSTQVVVDFKLTNTTVGMGSITAFGFSTNADVSDFAGATTGPGDPGDTALDADTFTQYGMKSIQSLPLTEVCMQHAPIGVDCHGGLVAFGMAPGEFDDFRVTLTGAGFADGLTSFNDFGVKFQESLTNGGYTFYANDAPAPVPEPASLLLLSTGLIPGTRGWWRRQATA